MSNLFNINISKIFMIIIKLVLVLIAGFYIGYCNGNSKCKK